MSDQDKNIKIDVTVNPAGVDKGSAETVSKLDALKNSINGVMDKLKDSVAGADNQMGELMLSASKMGLSLAALGAAAAVTYAGGMLMVAKGFIDTAAAAATTTQKTGESTEEMTRWQYAAKLSSVSSESLQTGMKELAKNMGEVISQTGDGGRIFKAFGIDVTDTRGNLRGTGEVLMDLADKFSKMEDGPTKSALAIKVFGRSGLEMIPILNQGREGIARLTGEADAFGTTIKDKTAREADAFNNNLMALQESSGKTARSMTKDLLPSLVAITTAMREGAREGGTLKGVIEGIRRAWSEAFFDSTQDKLKKIDAEIQQKIAQINRLERGGVRGIDQAPLSASYARLQELYRQRSQFEDLNEIETGGAFGSAPKTSGSDILSKLGKDQKEQRKKIADDSMWIAKQQFEAEEYWAKATVEAWQYVDKQELESYNATKAAEKASLKDWFKAIDQEQEVAIADGKAFLDAQKKHGMDTYEALKHAVEGWGKTFSKTMGEAVVTGKLTADKIKVSFISLAADIAAVQIQKRFTDPLVKAGTGILDRALEGLFGGSGGAEQLSGPDMPGRAGGGPVSAGRAYLVGEEGPEIMLTGRSGTVVPNNALRGAVPEIIFNVTNNTGQPVQMAQSGPALMSNGKLIVGLLLEELGSNQSSRNAMAAVLS